MSDCLPVLPDEVVAATILWRLPVKSILQCRCVCKSWNSLITSSNFISIHLLRNTLTLNPQILVGQFDMADKNGNYLLHFDENEDYLRSMLLHLLHPPPNCFIYTIGSVKGLICLCICGVKDGNINFILCNPSIRHVLSIPPPPLTERSRGVTGFGFDETCQDYKILLIIFGTTDGFIYSLSSNCWRVITCPVLTRMKLRQSTSAVSVNGRFHWLSYGPNSVIQLIVFDLKDEIFGHISLPECLPNSELDMISIEEFGQSSVAIIQRTRIMRHFARQAFEMESHIWVMKEYGLMESWMKIATIGDSELVLGFRNEDEVVVRCKSGCIASHKINHNESDQLEEVKKMMDCDKHPTLRFSAHKYVPSLALLDKQKDADVTLDVIPIEETADCVA